MNIICLKIMVMVDLIHHNVIDILNLIQDKGIAPIKNINQIMGVTVNKIYVIIKDTMNNIHENILYFIDIQEIKNFLGDYTYSNIMDLLLFIIFIVIIPLKICKYLYGLHTKLYLVKNNKFYNNIDEILFNYSNYILEYNQRENNNLKDKFRKEYLELCFILLSLYNKLVINGNYHICTIY